MSYDAHAKLTADEEGLISLGFNGRNFAEYAARNLLHGVSTGQLWDIHWACLLSAFAREDADAIRVRINDLKYWKPNQKPTARVTKFVPGQHFHALNEKFLKLDDAIAHVRNNGYEYGGFEEQQAFPEGG